MQSISQYYCFFLLLKNIIKKNWTLNLNYSKLLAVGEHTHRKVIINSSSMLQTCVSVVAPDLLLFEERACVSETSLVSHLSHSRESLIYHLWPLTPGQIWPWSQWTSDWESLMPLDGSVNRVRGWMNGSGEGVCLYIERMFGLSEWKEPNCHDGSVQCYCHA